MLNFSTHQMTETKHAKIDVAKYGSINGQLSPPKENVVKVKYSLMQWITLATLAFGNFCNSACISLQAPFFPAEAEKKGATLTQSGLIFGVESITVFIVAPLIGKLMSYIPLKVLLNLGFLTIGISCIAFGTLDLVYDSLTFIALAFTLRILEGVGSATLRTASYTVISVQFPDSLGSTFALLQIFNGVGVIVGRTLGGALYDIGGFGLPFYVVGSLLLIDTMVIFSVLPDVESKKPSVKNNFLSVCLHSSTLLYSLSIFTTMNFLGFNTAALEPHLREFNLSGFLLGSIFALGGVVYGVTSPFIGWLLDNNWDNHCMSLLGTFIIVISIIFMGPAPFFPFDTNLGVVIGALAISGLGTSAKLVSAFTGILKSITDRGLPSDLSTFGVVSSVIASSQSIGSFAGPSFGGYLVDEFGYRNASMSLLILETVLITPLIISVVKRLCVNTTSISFIEEPMVSMDNNDVCPEKYRANGCASQ